MRIGVSLEIVVRLFLSFFADLSFPLLSNIMKLKKWRCAYEREIEVNWGIYIGSVKPEWCTGTEVPLMELVAVNVKSKLLLMFLVVFVTYFAGSEGRNGFLKNIAGQVTHKGIFVFSKSVVISIFAVMMIAGAVLATMLGSVAFLGYINIANIGQGCVFLIVQILLHIAYGMFVLFLFNVTESSVATMLAGILIAAGILQIVDAILVSVFSKLQAISDFSIMNYLTSGNVGLLSLDSTSGLYIRASIIAVGAIVLMNTLSSVIIQRRDLK